MLENNLLRNYIILKLIQKHNFLTRYSLWVEIDRLGFKHSPHQIYDAVAKLEEEGKLNFIVTEVATKIDGIKKGWWKNRTTNKKFYSLTSDGFKELFKLEFTIRKILNG